MLLQQQPRSSGIYRQNAYEKKKKKKNLKEKGMFDMKEQWLLDQKWYIVTEKWFSDLKFN